MARTTEPHDVPMGAADGDSTTGEDQAMEQSGREAAGADLGRAAAASAQASGRERPQSPAPTIPPGTSAPAELSQQWQLDNGKRLDHAAHCEWAKQWPVHHAAKGGKGATQRLKALIKEGSLTAAQQRELLDKKETHTGRTALHYAVSIADMATEGATRPTQALLQHGADIFALDKDGCTPLDLALSFRDWEYVKGRLQVVSMLRSAVDVAWSKGRRPSPWSARHPWDLGYKEHHPLHGACCRDDLVAVQQILGPVPNDSTASLSVHIRITTLACPLHVVCFVLRTACCWEIACDTLTVDRVCRTPSQTPRALDGEEFDDRTSEATDQLEARNASGQTPLLVAAGNGSHSVAKLLLKHGADVTAKDCNGQDALDLAREGDNQGAMLSLLQNGPEGTGEAGVGNGAPGASQAKAAMEEQEDEEVESEEEEDPIAAALAKAAAAVAKADADHAADADAMRPAAGPRSGGVVRSSGSRAAVARGDSSRAAGGTSHGDGRVGSDAFAAVVNATKMTIGGVRSNEEPDLIVEVSTYAANVRQKRTELEQSRGGGSSSLVAASRVGRKPKPPGDSAAQADQAVQVCTVRHHSGCLNGHCNDSVCLAVC
jgi:ankyrin repeat protein